MSGFATLFERVAKERAQQEQLRSEFLPKVERKLCLVLEQMLGLELKDFSIRLADEMGLRECHIFIEEQRNPPSVHKVLLRWKKVGTPFLDATLFQSEGRCLLSGAEKRAEHHDLTKLLGILEDVEDEGQHAKLEVDAHGCMILLKSRSH